MKNLIVVCILVGSLWLFSGCTAVQPQESSLLAEHQERIERLEERVQHLEEQLKIRFQLLNPQ